MYESIFGVVLDGLQMGRGELRNVENRNAFFISRDLNIIKAVMGPPGVPSN